jgi:Alpha/beta hydrolase domain
VTRKLAAVFAFMAALSTAETVPAPQVTLLPLTASSRPLLAADHTMEPADLAKSGYAEAEFLVSGKANVYDWADDGSLTVKTPNAPYTDRILVRRPSDPSKFSGTIVVELMNSARRFDWAMMWGYLHDYLIERGDAWVGITMPASVAGLQKFDPTRYAALSFANPNPAEVCAAAPAARGGKGGPPAASPNEDGLRWDVLSQVAAALKSTDKNEPFTGFRVDRIYMTTQTADLETYINAIHSHADLASGKPAYDGYLIREPGAPAKIRNCAAAPAAGDPRTILKDVNVPIIAVAAQGEAVAAVPFRKPDSDSPSGRYRLYEIAGAAHIDKFAYSVAFPALADQTAAVGSAQGTVDWPFNAMCDPPIPLSELPLLKYSYDAALMNLDAWSRKGTAPPKEERMQVVKVQNGVISSSTLVLDDFGHAKGGVRSPWVDVPTATYTTTTPGPGTCAELGHAIPFTPDRIKTLYPSAQDYSKKVNADVDALVKAHWFTESDSKKMKAQLIAAFGK